MADFDINQARITGTVERFDRIATKTGTAMIKELVRCYKETVQVVAFRDLAEGTDLAPGDRLEVAGKIQNTSWTAQDGSRRYGWQLVAEAITLIGETQPAAPLTGETQPPGTGATITSAHILCQAEAGAAAAHVRSGGARPERLPGRPVLTWARSSPWSSATTAPSAP